MHILTELFGGDNAARDLTPAWDGGLYWAGQLRSATTPEEQASTKSLAPLLSLGLEERRLRAGLRQALRRQPRPQVFQSCKPVADDGGGPSAVDESDEQVFSTNEGPVVITTRGKLVFVAESFPLPLARKLTSAHSRCARHRHHPDDTTRRAGCPRSRSWDLG